MKKEYFRFGHTDLCITAPEEMKHPENLNLFAVQEADVFEEHCIQCAIDFAEDIGEAEKELLSRKVNGASEVIRDNLHVFYTDSGECRMIRFSGADKPYGISRQVDERHYEVLVDRMISHMLIFDTIFISLLSLEKHVMGDGAMVLHSAYMCLDGSAVLFSAPSETGKSTQANLWEKYRGTYTVNGDRSLLVREEQGWMAFGWPVCGSSEICHNEAHPVQAIVMVKQAKENRAYRMKGIQALREVMEQITINSWNRKFQMKAMDQIDLLLREVPVYRLECNISEDAVRCLEEALERGIHT